MLPVVAIAPATASSAGHTACNARRMLLLVAAALAECPWTEDTLTATGLAAIANPLRWDATDDKGQRLDPEALDEALSHRRPWHLHRALLDTRPYDLLVTLFDGHQDVRTNLAVWADGPRLVLAWREHTLFDEREVYTENKVVIWGLVDRQAVAYEAIILPDHRLYAGFSETCR